MNSFGGHAMLNVDKGKENQRVRRSNKGEEVWLLRPLLKIFGLAYDFQSNIAISREKRL